MMNNLITILDKLGQLGVFLNVYYTTKVTQSKLQNQALLKVYQGEFYVEVNNSIKQIFNTINFNSVKDAKERKYYPKNGKTVDYPKEFQNAYLEVKQSINRNSLIGVNRYCEGLLQAYYSPKNKTTVINANVSLYLDCIEFTKYFGVSCSGHKISLKDANNLLSAHMASVNSYISTQLIVNPPSILPQQTTFNNTIQVTISATNGENVYYTTNNSKPIVNQQIQKSNTTFQISQTTTIRAIAEKNGIVSKKVSKTYTIKPLTQKPVITPLVRTFTASSKIEIKASPNATIYYSKNGVPPLKNKANEYSFPFPIYGDTTVIAIAEELNHTDNLEQADFTLKKQGIDVEKKKEVEIIAVDTVTEHYENLGYTITSFEADNIGWDLEADNGTECLKIEVKGLSGKCINVELTPNEFKQMQNNSDDYKLAIVTDTHGKPEMKVFVYNVKSGSVVEENNSNNEIVVDKIVGARIKE